MVTQEILTNEEGRKKLLEGARKLASAVEVTLGSKGRNVIIDRGEGQTPHITKDGVTVARSITPSDNVEAMGSKIILDAANKTVLLAGDGTSSATILAYAMIEKGFEVVKDSKVNATEVKNGIDKAVKLAVEKIKELSKPIEENDETELRNIARISANNDIETGDIVADAIIQVGKYGSVSVETSKGSETKIKKVEGLQFDSGFKSPLFINNRVRGECVLYDVQIFLYDNKITSVQDILPVAEYCVKENKALLVIAEDIDGEALSTLLMNSHSGRLKSCAIPFGRIMFGTFDDIAAITGAKIISYERGEKASDAPVSCLGYAAKVVVTQGSTIIIDGIGQAEDIEARKLEVQAKIEDAPDGYVLENLKMRLAKLNNGVAVIEVGGFSKVEIDEKKDRIDDAIHATQAAIEEGYVAGGGTTLLHCVSAIEKGDYKRDEVYGKDIVLYALSCPFKAILNNGGILDMVDKELRYGDGIDVNRGEWVDLFKEGIIDPAKVVRVALENAGSVAAIFVTTQCVVYNVPDPIMG